MFIPFKVEHSVHHMFKQLRPGDSAIFGHMPNEDDGYASLFSCPNHPRSGFPHLPDTARR
ncbi:MAG: hypothetical protein DDT38_01172 [Firmicutes bacterium]|nr:hypothetical protein [candidate division NPL-UPA2 bacterium]